MTSYVAYRQTSAGIEVLGEPIVADSAMLALDLARELHGSGGCLSVARADVPLPSADDLAFRRLLFDPIRQPDPDAKRDVHSAISRARIAVGKGARQEAIALRKVQGRAR